MQIAAATTEQMPTLMTSFVACMCPGYAAMPPFSSIPPTPQLGAPCVAQRRSEKNFVNNLAAYLKQPLRQMGEVDARCEQYFPFLFFSTYFLFLCILFTIKIPARQFTKICVV